MASAFLKPGFQWRWSLSGSRKWCHNSPHDQVKIKNRSRSGFISATKSESEESERLLIFLRLHLRLRRLRSSCYLVKLAQTRL